jgi:hypothetical protein
MRTSPAAERNEWLRLLERRTSVWERIIFANCVASHVGCTLFLGLACSLCLTRPQCSLALAFLHPIVVLPPRHFEGM